MKKGILVIVCIIIAFVSPGFATMIIVLGATLYGLNKILSRGNTESRPPSEPDYGHLTRPGEDFHYYEIVGMQYREDLDEPDFGIHTSAKAVTEPDNPFDKYAVAIHRDELGSVKKIGYVPRSNNEELFNFLMNECDGETMAVYKLWRRNDKMYCIAYIKDCNEASPTSKNNFY